MALIGMKVYLVPPENRGTSLPFDGVIEYSRNERGKEIVKVRVIPTPNDATIAGEQITVRIMKARRTRIEEVVQARTVFTFPAGPVDVRGVEFEFDLRLIVYSSDKPFPIMRRGDYFFKIDHTGGPSGPSALSVITEDYRVALLTTDRLEQEWLLGATRRSNDDRSVRFQPRVLTGVKIMEVGRNHPLDMYPLALVKGAETLGGSSEDNRYLSWDEGEAVKIDMRIPEGIQQQYILMNAAETNYVLAQVDPTMLPAISTTERLMVDRTLLERESLRRWIDAECDWAEKSFLFTPIEPALCVSDYSLSGLDPGSGGNPAPLPNAGDNYDYDLMGPPCMYRPPTSGHWIDVLLPFGLPLKWDYLIGALEQTRIVDVNVGWIQPEQGRFIQLLPFNQTLAYNFIGLMYVAVLRGPVELPSFWRYRYWAGLREPVMAFDLIELLGMRAAVQALTVLGQMYRGGFSSQSISKGGVSESVSYTASAMYGIYSASIGNYEKRIKTLQTQIKRRIFGLYLATL